MIYHHLKFGSFDVLRVQLLLPGVVVLESSHHLVDLNVELWERCVALPVRQPVVVSISCEAELPWGLKEFGFEIGDCRFVNKCAFSFTPGQPNV